MTTVLRQDRPDTNHLVGHIRHGTVRVERGAASELYQLLVHKPQDEWDRKMKENYEDGGALKKLVQKGREDYRTGNTSRLP